MREGGNVFQEGVVGVVETAGCDCGQGGEREQILKEGSTVKRRERGC